MKVIQKKVVLVIPANQLQVTEPVTLPHGFVTRVAAYPSIGATAENNLLSLGFKDDESIEIIPAINIENWLQRAGGSYMDSMKPLNMDTGGRQYFLNLSTDIVVSVPIRVEVVFLYETAK